MTSTPSKSLTYAQAGVSIDAGNQLVENIKPLVKATRRSGADASIGGFGGVFDLKPLNYKDPLIISTTDGVGTKLKVAEMVNNHKTIGIDLVAMCVNDLIVQGAEPLFFLDYFATGKLDVTRGTEIIAGIAEGCKQAGCALTGGETAEMPGMYQGDDYDLAGFAVGIVERDKLLPVGDKMQAGDALIALASSGVHSNGFSLVRHIMSETNTNYMSMLEGTSQLLGDALIVPTKIYVKPVLAALRKHSILGLSHITGGGLTENLPRVIPDGLAAEINLSSWKLSPLFAWLQKAGNVSEMEMLRTFNCGVGMVLVCKQSDAKEVIATLQTEGETAWQIGTLKAHEGKSETTYTGMLG